MQIRNTICFEHCSPFNLKLRPNNIGSSKTCKDKKLPLGIVNFSTSVIICLYCHMEMPLIRQIKRRYSGEGNKEMFI